MQDAFVREMTVSRVRGEDVWPLLRDVDMLAGCSSAIGQVEERKLGQEWSVSLIRKVGRFQMAAPLDVVILSEDEGKELRVEARGTDRKIGARLNVDASMEMDTTDQGDVRLRLRGHYEVTGRIASLGSAIVRRHAIELVDEFSQNLVVAVERRARQPSR
jgi:carbon monoxide dehydrogenase subunit G